MKDGYLEARALARLLTLQRDREEQMQRLLCFKKTFQPQTHSVSARGMSGLIVFTVNRD